MKNKTLLLAYMIALVAFIALFLSSLHPDSSAYLWTAKLGVIFPYVLFMIYAAIERVDMRGEVSTDLMYDVVRRIILLFIFFASMSVVGISIIHGGGHCYGSSEVWIGTIGWVIIFLKLFWSEQDEHDHDLDLIADDEPAPGDPEHLNCNTQPQ